MFRLEVLTVFINFSSLTEVVYIKIEYTILSTFL